MNQRPEPMPNLSRVPMPWAWIAAAVLITVVASVVMLRIIYPELADPMPVHWNAGGEADRFMEKTPGAFLTSILLGPVILIVVMVGCATLISMQSGTLTQRGGAATAGDARRTHGGLERMQVHLARFMFIMNLIILSILGSTYGGHGGPVFLIGLIAILASSAGLILAQIRVQASLRQKFPLPPGEAGKWWGILYRDPEDPRILIDTGTGSNFTFNVGRTAGKVAALLVLGVPLLILAVVLLVAI
ncbi:DUF1648 domain-containing protein [Corynebacterium pacaense]|uniref:DUF1648 domain-containing protein n=1 Tax=Corynebacterium pacaense TaxID=1816684 RepID=UPI0009BAEA09|nr:DUF1648 domain-containing protein [Corynebacterium pacaense]